MQYPVLRTLTEYSRLYRNPTEEIMRGMLQAINIQDGITFPYAVTQVPVPPLRQVPESNLPCFHYHIRSHRAQSATPSSTWRPGFSSCEPASHQAFHLDAGVWSVRYTYTGLVERKLTLVISANLAFSALKRFPVMG